MGNTLNTNQYIPSKYVESVNESAGNVYSQGFNILVNSSFDYVIKASYGIPSWTVVSTYPDNPNADWDVGIIDKNLNQRVIKIIAEYEKGSRFATLLQENDLTKFPSPDYTFSAWIYSPEDDTPMYLSFQSGLPDNNYKEYKRREYTLSAGWNFCQVTYSPRSSDILTKVRVNISTGSIDRTRYFYVWHPKLELGNVATPWTPSVKNPVLMYESSQMHRNKFRGAYLGDKFTDEQKAAVAAGTFDDLYVGDYWVINERTWRIADFDYWFYRGGPDGNACTKHHIVVVPDGTFGSRQMNVTESGEYEAGTANSTENGYLNSGMRTVVLPEVKTTIEEAFGVGALLKHRELLVNAVKNGIPSGGTWVDSEVELMSERMVYGAPLFQTVGSSDGTTIAYNHSIGYDQLALFKQAPYYILSYFNGGYQYYWLRDVVSKTQYGGMSQLGNPAYAEATNRRGVRPVFGLVGA